MDKLAQVLEAVKALDLNEPEVALNFEKAEANIKFIKEAAWFHNMVKEARGRVELLKEAKFDIGNILGDVGGFMGKNQWLLPLILSGLGGSIGGAKGGPLMGLLMAALLGGGGFGLQKLLGIGGAVEEEPGVSGVPGELGITDESFEPRRAKLDDDTEEKVKRDYAKVQTEKEPFAKGVGEGMADYPLPDTFDKDELEESREKSKGKTPARIERGGGAALPKKRILR